MKTRMQVLAVYFEPTIEYDNDPSKDMQLAITLNPDLKRIEGAMEEYAEQAVKLALEKAAEKGGNWATNSIKKVVKDHIKSITPDSIINEIENNG